MHGVGHHKGVHGCDGCCANAPKAIWDEVTEDKPTPPRAPKEVPVAVLSPNFYLMIDEQRCSVLVSLQNLVADKGGEFMLYLAHEGLAGAAAEMFQEIKEKEHQQKWCKDPECEWDKQGDNEPGTN